MIFDVAYAASVLPLLLDAFTVTVAATLVGMTLAAILGLAWALARMGPAPLAWPATFAVEFLRSTPLLVQLYFLFFVFPDYGLTLGAFATGVLGLGLHYSAYTAEIYRAGIESVPRGQWEAARALGFSGARTWLSVVLPQAIRPVVPALGNRFIAMFKDTPLLSAITVVEVLQAAKIAGAESFRYLEPLTVVGVLFLLVSLLAAAAVGRVEAAMARTV